MHTIHIEKRRRHGRSTLRSNNYASDAEDEALYLDDGPKAIASLEANHIMDEHTIQV